MRGLKIKLIAKIINSGLFCLLFLSSTINATAQARERVTHVQLPTQGKLQYIEYLPKNFDPQKNYPVILGFSGGSQNKEAGRSFFRDFLKKEATNRNYIVLVPITRKRQYFFIKSDQFFTEFKDFIFKHYNVLDDKFHLMGYSNGGISAFHFAVKYPHDIRSVSTWPGYLAQLSNASIARLEGVCITYYWGSKDEGWGIEANNDSEELINLHIRHLNISIENETHYMRALRKDLNATIFDRIENCDTTPYSDEEVAVLRARMADNAPQN